MKQKNKENEYHMYHMHKRFESTVAMLTRHINLCFFFNINGLKESLPVTSAQPKRAVINTNRGNSVGIIFIYDN